MNASFSLCESDEFISREITVSLLSRCFTTTFDKNKSPDSDTPREFIIRVEFVAFEFYHETHIHEIISIVKVIGALDVTHILFTNAYLIFRAEDTILWHEQLIFGLVVYARNDFTVRKSANSSLFILTFYRCNREHDFMILRIDVSRSAGIRCEMHEQRGTRSCIHASSRVLIDSAVIILAAIPAEYRQCILISLYSSDE